MNQHLLWDLGERAVRHFNSAFGSSRIASPAYPEWPTCNRHSTPGFRSSNPGLLPILSLRIGQGRSTPEASNHSLYLIKLTTDCSYPEGNFGGNQLLDGSISLSPLYPNLTIDLHVRIATSLHQSFPWLYPIQA